MQETGHHVLSAERMIHSSHIPLQRAARKRKPLDPEVAEHCKSLTCPSTFYYLYVRLATLHQIAQQLGIVPAVSCMLLGCCLHAHVSCSCMEMVHSSRHLVMHFPGAQNLTWMTPAWSFKSNCVIQKPASRKIVLHRSDSLQAMDAIVK